MAHTFVDTHCHLDIASLSEAIEEVLARAQDAGVSHCISLGTNLASSRANVEIANRYPMVRAAVGLHPHEAASATKRELELIDALCEEPCVVAVGEVGLDYYRKLSSRKKQRDILLTLIALAERRRLPLAIHCRSAHEDLLDVLGRFPSGSLRGVMHCASGRSQFIHAALELGFHISFAGNVTYPGARDIQGLVSLVPDERLLLETDAPYLSPQPVRGRTNEPAYIVHTAAYLADARGTTLESLADLTSRNATKLFGLPDKASGSLP